MGGELFLVLAYAPTFRPASVYGLRPLAVVSDIWQPPAQIHCFNLGPEVASTLD
jgi:hypothetical protein